MIPETAYINITNSTISWFYIFQILYLTELPIKINNLFLSARQK